MFPGSCILGLHSTTMPNKQRYCGQLQNHVRIPNFRGWNWKTAILGKYYISSWSYDRKVMPRNEWNDIVSWQTKRLNSSAKNLLHASMTIISKKKNWNPWENCQKCALELFWNACTWHELDDLIFHGQSTNLHARSQSGPELPTNAWIDWYLTY